MLDLLMENNARKGLGYDEWNSSKVASTIIYRRFIDASSQEIC